jgi:hypothetical protein
MSLSKRLGVNSLNTRHQAQARELEKAGKSQAQKLEYLRVSKLLTPVHSQQSSEWAIERSEVEWNLRIVSSTKPEFVLWLNL